MALPPQHHSRPDDTYYTFVLGSRISADAAACQPPLQEYVDHSNVRYVGIEYGRAAQIMQKRTESADGKSLQLCNIEPPVGALEQFQKQYPDVTPQRMAFLYTGAWRKYTMGTYMCSGGVRYGYWITNMPDVGDQRMGNVMAAVPNLCIVGHNMTDFGQIPSEYFYGIACAEMANLENECTDNEQWVHQEIATFLCAKHMVTPAIAAKLPASSAVLEAIRVIVPEADVAHSTPVMAFVQSMCYCCT
jgi:hypothetical protein